jgi:hypothetical protein
VYCGSVRVGADSRNAGSCVLGKVEPFANGRHKQKRERDPKGHAAQFLKLAKQVEHDGKNYLLFILGIFPPFLYMGNAHSACCMYFRIYCPPSLSGKRYKEAALLRFVRVPENTLK